jgi:hypothetical protein
MAILVVPTLLDFWITPSTVSTPWLCVSEMVEPVMVRRPGLVSMTVPGLTRPVSSASANGEGLHGRAGLEGVGQARLRSCSPVRLLALVGHVAGVVGQRQHLAGDRIEHHHAARLGLVGLHGVAQLLVGKELHLAVDGQLHVFARPRGHLLAHVFDHAAHAVLDDAARTGLPASCF